MPEVLDSLWLTLIRNSKTFLSEICYRMSILANFNVNMDQRDIASECRLCLSEQQKEQQHVGSENQHFNGQSQSARFIATAGSFRLQVPPSVTLQH